MASRRTKTVERTIHFYRADAGAVQGVPRTLDLELALNAVSKLAFDDGSRRYWEQPTGDVIAVWTDESPTPRWDRFSLATVRRTGLPRAEHKGRLKAVPLASGAGLHEPIHIRTYPDNIFGIEFNFYGPRPSRLPQYLQYAAGDACPAFTLEPLLRRDVADQLTHQGDLRLLDLQIRSSYAATIERAQPRLGRALVAAAEASNAQVVGLTLRPEPHGRHSLARHVLDFAKSLAARADLQENATRFRIKGVNADTGQVDELDLLETRLVSKQQMVSIGGNSRAIRQDSAFAAIDVAYDELKAQLLTAPSVRVVSDG